MWARRLLCAVVVGAIGGLATAGVAAASAAPGALTVSARPGNDRTDAQVASNASGLAAAFWKAPPAGGTTKLLVATRAPGGRWSRPATVDAANASRYDLRVVRVAVDSRSVVHLLWARQTPHRSELQLVAATRRGAGRLSKPVRIGESAIAGLLDDTINGDMAVAPNGTATVVWCQGGVSDNALDTKHPGTVFARTAVGTRRWSAPSKLWKGYHCAGAAVQADSRGNTLATWNDEFLELDDSVKLMKLRQPGKRWPTKPTYVTELGDGGAGSSTIPFLGPAGVVHLFTFDPQNSSGSLGLRYAIQNATTTTPTETLPTPTEAQTDGGWLGTGSLESVTDRIDGHGTPVSVMGVGGEALSKGGLGTSALWASSRSAAGWSLTPLDAFAQASDPASQDESPRPDLQLDAAGRVIATWAEIGSQTPCRVETFQSTRNDDGTWSPRVLAADAAGSGSGTDCDAGDGPSALPPASLLWTTTSHELRIQPSAGASDGAPIAPVVQLLTPTWSAVQKAGAIELSCGAAAAGYCHVSLIAAEHDPATLDALEGFCRPSLATTQITDPAKPGVVRFPLDPRCFEGGPAPGPSATPASFPVYAVADVVGHRSGASTTTLTIGVG